MRWTTTRPLFFSILLILGAALPGAAQDADERDPLRTLLENATRDDNAYRMLTSLTAVAPHRLSGTQGNLDGNAWALEVMEEMGLDTVEAQPVMVPHWDRGSIATLTLEGESIPIVALGGSVATPKKGIKAQVVAVDSFEELAALGEEGVKGRIVLFSVIMDPSLPSPFSAYGRYVRYRWGGAAAAAKLGARAVLVRSMTLKRDDVPHGGGMGYEDGVDKIPAAAVSWQGVERILATLADKPKAKATLSMDCGMKADAESANIQGDLVGAELPNEVVVLSCHLDSWDLGESAHDDGAGCVHVLEAMRLLKESGWTRRRTVRALLYANEENGGRGGRAYAESYGGGETGERIVLAVESDRGGFAPLGFTTPAGAEWETILREAASGLAPIYADRVERGFSGADVRHLAPHRVATAGLLVNPHRYFDFHHSANDKLVDVHPRELALGAVSLAWLAQRVADREGALPDAEPPPSR